MPQLATSGPTYWAVEQSKTVYAVEDRCRGFVGLVGLVFGFGLQLLGDTLILTKAKAHYGTGDAVVGAGIALLLVLLIVVGESVVRPRWRDHTLIQVAKYDPMTKTVRELPRAIVLRTFGEDAGTAKLEGESDVDYCARVFHSTAEDW
jgi:hypothetical protein